MNSNNSCTSHYEAVSGTTNDSSHNVDIVNKKSERPWNGRLKNQSTNTDQQQIDLNPSEFTDKRDIYSLLHEITHTVFNAIQQQIIDSMLNIHLIDKEGAVVNITGDVVHSNTQLTARRHLDTIWPELVQENRAFRSCALKKQPFTIYNNNQFNFKTKKTTRTTVTVHDPYGELIATINASNDSNPILEHTIDLIKKSALVIENQLLLACMKDKYIARFHSQPELISTSGECILAFDGIGKIEAANNNAKNQLNITSEEILLGRNVSDFFDMTICNINNISSSNIEPVLMFEKVQEASFHTSFITPDEHDKTNKNRLIVTRSTTEFNKKPGLDELEYGDASMHRNIDRAKKLLERDIPFILLGETGTGKDVFANAIHQESSRANKPFVAVNCASLPETLIESELFGYRPGAFTGASKDGSRGKIVQANGGTLFLDEIGDMPLHLQARLLRVLEEREVIPLGGEVAKKVDIRLISATHKELPQLVEEGRFRVDLYYRLNGISLQMPPLRDRDDKQIIIDHLLHLEAGPSVDITIENNALDALYTYQWPGNFRQLRNILRTIIGLCDDGIIRLQDLPDEIFSANLETSSLKNEPKRQNNPLEVAERNTIIREMELAYWNVTQVASKLGVSRNTLYRKMRNLDIIPPR
ncbi:MAG: sigma-54-dependent Fis family transcriptional regulator [Candidatus Thiodiazotropha sp. LLP2]